MANNKTTTQLAIEWKDEIKQLITDYQIHITNLNNARIAFENQTKGWHVRYYPIFFILVAVFAILLMNYFVKWESIEFFNIKITRVK